MTEEPPPLLPTPPSNIREILEKYFITDKGLKYAEKSKLIKWIIENIPKDRRLEFLSSYTSSEDPKVKKLMSAINTFEKIAYTGRIVVNEASTSEAENVFKEEVHRKVYAEPQIKRDSQSIIGKLADTAYTVMVDTFPKIYSLALEYGYDDTPDGIKSFIEDIIEFWVTNKDTVDEINDLKILVKLLVTITKPAFLVMACNNVLYRFYMECVKMKAMGYKLDNETIEILRDKLKDDMLKLLNALYTDTGE